MRKLLLAALFFAIGMNASSQSIFQIMERSDLQIDVVERMAKRYFDSAGTGKGTGYKQYQRWLYERKFHLDEDGYFINPQTEEDRFKMARNQRKQNDSGSRMTVAAWTELGPKAWTKTSSWAPGVGRITSVAVHPANEAVIYISSSGGGIWKSTNSGAGWTPLIDHISSAWMDVYNLCIDPSNQNIIYTALTNGGVIKSTNAGSTWFATGSGPSLSRKVRVHPSNSNIVFTAANNGLYRSANGGSTWSQVQSQTKEDIEFKPNDPNIMYASGSSGTSCVWRSTDNGITWTAIGTGSGITYSGRTLLGVSPNNPNVVYAVQANGSLFGRMYRSVNAGLTYITTVTGSPSTGTNYFGYSPDGTDTRGQAWYDMAICVNPVNAQEVHIAGINCWRSLNGGTSFSPTTDWVYPNNYGYNHCDVHALEWVNNTIYSGTDGGIYKSTNNAGDWTDLSTGLGIKQIYRLTSAKTDANVITVGAQDNGSSFRKPGGNWVDWLGADGMDNLISPTNASIAIGTSQNGSIYKTTNAGDSYTNLPNPSNGNWVTPLVMHPSNHNIIYGGWTGIYRSDNGGSQWTKISGSVISGMLNTLAVAPSNTNYIYGTIGSTVYRTSNGGSSWTSVAAPASVNAIFVSHNNPQKIWIACNSITSRVFVSTNMGTSFTDLSAGLPAIAARSIVVDNNSEESVYVGMSVGVYYRDNIETAWVEHAPGLPLVAVSEVDIQKSSGKLRVATYGRGVWQTDLYLPSGGVCNAPAGATVANITATSATLSWAPVQLASDYYIYYWKPGDANWTLGPSGLTVPQAVLSGLTPGATYYADIWVHCSTGQYLSSRVTFTTASSLARTAVVTAEKNNVIENKALRIYPTKLKASQTLVVDLNDFINSTHKLLLSVYDVNGKPLHKRQIASGMHSLSPESLGIRKTGFYVIRIHEGENVFTGKLMFEN